MLYRGVISQVSGPFTRPNQPVPDQQQRDGLASADPLPNAPNLVLPSRLGLHRGLPPYGPAMAYSCHPHCRPPSES
jgi:hypothetical protein